METLHIFETGCPSWGWDTLSHSLNDLTPTSRITVVADNYKDFEYHQRGSQFIFLINTVL
jgi:hypothetical protein